MPLIYDRSFVEGARFQYINRNDIGAVVVQVYWEQRKSKERKKNAKVE
jgi:hypothetical protein